MNFDPRLDNPIMSPLMPASRLNETKWWHRRMSARLGPHHPQCTMWELAYPSPASPAEALIAQLSAPPACVSPGLGWSHARAGEGEVTEIMEFHGKHLVPGF